MTSRKHQLREFAAEAEALGYTFAGLTARGHLKWRHRNGALVIGTSDMTQTRTRHNVIRQLRHSARRRLSQRQSQQEASP